MPSPALVDDRFLPREHQDAGAAPVVRDDASEGACDAYVIAHPSGKFYHRPAWLGIVRRAFGRQTRYLTAESGGRIVGVLPLVFFRSRVFGHFAVSMPFLNYGGILADTPAVERALLDRATDEAKKAGAAHLELRHTRQLFPELPARRHKVAMTLRLESTPGRQWELLDRKVRNQVRKAEKSNLEAEHGGIEMLDAFYEVFSRNMRDLGTPVYGVNFFREVLSTFPESTRVFVVRSAKQPVAASLVVWHRGKIEVPWASSIREFNPLCANVLLYWEMLKFSSAGGFTTFDFGRSTRGEGTFHFKRQWGAEPRELVWEYWTDGGHSIPDLSPANPRFGLAIKAWQHLPVKVATTLGPFIVRNIP
jgi:FemAB-related protein (PEP-CTERM system-associated)